MGVQTVASNVPPTLGFLLNDVARLMRKRFEQRARELGLTRAQWQVLAYLAANEGIHQGGLAELLEIEPITLVRILDRLEERGLVERRPHARDRRIRLLYLAGSARPLLDRMRVIGDAVRGEVFSDIPEAQRDALVAVLSTMKANLIEACGRPADEPREASRG